MSLILRNLLLSYPGIILSTLATGMASLAVSFFSKTGRTQHKLAVMWARQLLWICGIRLKVEGAENIPPGGSYVFVSNHRSYFDSPIVLPTVDVQFRFLAKNSVFYWPLIGFHLRRAGHLPVHYTNPRASLKSMSAAARNIQEKGISILLFPEAGRTMGELEPFKDGAAYIAIKAGVPVIPIGIVGSLEILPTGAFWIRPGTVTVRFGTPIPTLDIPLAERTQLTQTMYNRVAELIGLPVAVPAAGA